MHGGYYTDIWALYFILTLMKAGLEKQKWRGYKRMGLKLRLWRKDGDDPDFNGFAFWVSWNCVGVIKCRV